MNAQTEIDRAAIARKIKALLAKTTQAGCSEEEAMNAALLAAKLQAEYNINLTEAEIVQEGFETVTIPWTSDKYQYIEDRIAVAIAAFTSTKVWTARPKQAGRGKKKKLGIYSVKFCGLKSDAQFAEWLIKSLSAFIHFKATYYAKQFESSDRTNVYKSFVMGACGRINERLNAIQQKPWAQNATRTALVVIDKQLIIKKHLEESGVKFGKGVPINDKVAFGSAFVDGLSAGDCAGFNRPINKSGEVNLLK